MCYPDLAVGFLRGSYLELCVVDTFEVLPRSRSVIPSFGNASPSPSWRRSYGQLCLSWVTLLLGPTWKPRGQVPDSGGANQLYSGEYKLGLIKCAVRLGLTIDQQGCIRLESVSLPQTICQAKLWGRGRSQPYKVSGLLNYVKSTTLTNLLISRLPNDIVPFNMPFWEVFGLLQQHCP